jgi:hypothetical protein
VGDAAKSTVAVPPPEAVSPKGELRGIEEAALTGEEFSSAPSAGVLTAAKPSDHLLNKDAMNSGAEILTRIGSEYGNGYPWKDTMRATILHRRVFASLLAVFLVLGCGSVLDQAKLSKFNDTSKSYGEALVWGYYAAANLYRKPELAEREKPNFENLKNIKVAQYDIMDMDMSEDGLRIDQLAEITYFHRNKMILKTIRDQQVWEFDSKDRRWYLTTPMPEFP